MSEPVHLVDPERRWIEELISASEADRSRVLIDFARQYHWFSVHQVIAFAGIFRTIPPDDRAMLATVADVLADELGHGDLERVHSIVFERFATAVGAGDLPIPDEAVLPELVGYASALREAIDGDVVTAAAAYQFLEQSAVAGYEPLLAAFRTIGLSEDSLEFFVEHAEVEVGHLEKASEFFHRVVLSEADDQRAMATGERLAAAWGQFWEALVRLSFG